MSAKKKAKITVYGTKTGRKAGGIWIKKGKVDIFIGLHMIEKAVEAAKSGEDFEGEF